MQADVEMGHDALSLSFISSDVSDSVVSVSEALQMTHRATVLQGTKGHLGGLRTPHGSHVGNP